MVVAVVVVSSRASCITCSSTNDLDALFHSAYSCKESFTCFFASPPSLRPPPLDDAAAAVVVIDGNDDNCCIRPPLANTTNNALDTTLDEASVDGNSGACFRNSL